MLNFNNNRTMNKQSTTHFAKALAESAGFKYLEIEGVCPKHGEYKFFAVCDQNGRPLGDDNHCPECLAEEVDAKRRADTQAAIAECEARAKAVIDDGSSTSDIPRLYARHSFNNFNAVSAAQKRAYALSRGWAVQMYHGEDEKPWLAIYGTVGTGKTHLAVSAFRALASKHANGHYTTAAEIVRRIMESWNPGAKPSTSQLIDAYARMDMLLIDELGRTKGVPEKAEQVLFEIVEKRYRDMKPTIFVTNCGEHELDRVIDGAIYSRMKQLAVFVPMCFEDQRGKH